MNSAKDNRSTSTAQTVQILSCILQQKLATAKNVWKTTLIPPDTVLNCFGNHSVYHPLIPVVCIDHPIIFITV